jgi:phosphopantothenoylcysteine decarboxylase
MKDKGKNIFLAPAMNTAMWQHPITEEQIERLQKFGYNIILPVEKKLACGDFGKSLY